MSEKRFKMEIPINNGNHPLLKDNETGKIVEIVNVEMLIKKMNEQQEEIAYWKHRVSSLLFILSQFDNDKVKKLLEELDE